MTITEKALIRAAKAYEAIPSDDMRLLLHFAAHMALRDPSIPRVSDRLVPVSEGTEPQ